MSTTRARRKRPYARARDHYTVHKEILKWLKENGPTSTTHLSYAVELNALNIAEYIESMTANGLIRIIPITYDNRYKYSKYLFGPTKRLIIPTKKGLNLLNMIQQLPVIDFSNRGLRPSSKP